MMFTTLFYVTVVTFLVQQLPFAVEAKLVMSIVLNGGTLPTTEGYNCSDNDAQLIKTAIGADDDDDDDSADEEEDDRRLRTYAKKCKDFCMFFARNTCHVTGCFGYRRRTLQENDPRANRLSAHRKLDDDEAICASGITALNTDLDNLLPQLSEGCRLVVQNKRAVSCFDDVRYATVKSFTLWNADTDTIVQDNIQNNTSFCYTNRTMNIEAVTNACVEEIDLNMKGPVSRSREIESSGPYSIFGNVGDDDFLGRVLPVGTYTVRSTLDGSLTPTSRVTFMVKRC